ncbi:secreted salivary gland peptide, putative [Ixodes scapularis]|uniref:Secreted salivary gland peptide, putative n=1 Tax=Ixodes scapularis TaxID=6945 RepID=B7PB04_IXOSC|nr:secreted salivary gland peptide, putative [Ixodes scapularis]|eukprot:XP_002407604.1 secreted salivary gland peptide, putative [Ixodes scapularis]
MGIPTTLFYALVVFSLIWEISQAIHPPYGKVKIVKGKCKYKNRLVADGASLRFENPCQSWTCDVRSRSFAILPCGIIANPMNCPVFKGTGPYPSCCYEVNCTGTDQSEDTWFYNK